MMKYERRATAHFSCFIHIVKTLEDLLHNNNIKFFFGAFKKLNALTLYIKKEINKLLKTYKMFLITVLNKIIEITN